jgi:uncharacterized membrane protein
MVFSVTFVAVLFGAVAYSRRLVAVLANQPRLYHALGLFFATFAFALSALSWTDRGGSGAAPMISTYVVLALLVASMLAFAGLIRTIQDLQIQCVLTAIGKGGRAVVEAMPMAGEPGPAPSVRETPPLARAFVYAGEPVVVASLDLRRLEATAVRADCVIVIECAVGDTLVEGTPVLRIHGAEAPPAASLGPAIHVASGRTFEQDPKYPLRLLVDVAIRALSPAVNDPTTAVQALDQIEDLMVRLGARRLDVGQVYDGAGVLRVSFPTPTWDDYLSLAFDEIRQFGEASMQVSRRMRAVLHALAAKMPVAERRIAVLDYLRHLDETVGRSPFDDHDRREGMREDRQGLGTPRGLTPGWPRPTPETTASSPR